MIVGIDPGATGAVAYLADTGELELVSDLPYVGGNLSAPLLAGMLLEASRQASNAGRLADPRETERVTVWLERAQAYPGQGSSSTFNYGTGYGTIIGVTGALRFPLELVTPAVWKRAAGLNRDKGVSRRRAAELWPEHAGRFARVKDDGRAEAALIARHGWAATRARAAAPRPLP